MTDRTRSGASITRYRGAPGAEPIPPDARRARPRGSGNRPPLIRCGPRARRARMPSPTRLHRSPPRTPRRRRMGYAPAGSRERCHRAPSWRYVCIRQWTDPRCRRPRRAWYWRRPAAAPGRCKRDSSGAGSLASMAHGGAGAAEFAVDLERPCPVGLAVRHEHGADGVHRDQRTDHRAVAEVERGGSQAALDRARPSPRGRRRIEPSANSDRPLRARVFRDDDRAAWRPSRLSPPLPRS